MTRGGWLWAGIAFTAVTAFAQNAELSGLILDPSNVSVPGAEVTLRNDETGGRRVTKSSPGGFYSFSSLKPGEYRLTVRAVNFETTIQEGIHLEVGATARIDFNLRIGDVRTEVTIRADSPLVNNENASVGTVIGRKLIDEMPLNGRGIQVLIELSPGTVTLPVVTASGGQFAINGQRSNANYFTVDGVTTNFGIGRPLSASGGYSGTQIGSGMTAANNFFGTLSNLVAPESLQEFKIQTSTFAPEFGRSSGGQIGLVTRSGTNRYSGALFEYFRNDKADANDWFANAQGLPRAVLRFNNFGGVFGGPVRIPRIYNGHDRTFFFVSVDELFAAQPQPPSASIPVPTVEARQSASPLLAQLLKGYPLPNRPPTSETPAGFAEYVGTYSLSQVQHALSIRGDHTFNERWTSFARYSRTPSERRAALPDSPAVVNRYTLTTEAVTFGLTHAPRSNLIHDLRLNASRQIATAESIANQAGGAEAPLDSLLLPSGYSFKDSLLLYGMSPGNYVQFGQVQNNRTRQLQAVDSFSLSRGGHQLKFGADYRWFSPLETGTRFQYFFAFSDIEQAAEGIIPSAQTTFSGVRNTAFIVESFSAHAQDTWKINRKLTLTYGLRWEIAPGPRVSAGEAATARGVPGGSIEYVPAGQSPYATGWANLAPRFGLAWQALDHGLQKTVVRIGGGAFFDPGQAGLQGQGQRGDVTTLYFNQPLGSPAGGFAYYVLRPGATSTLPGPVVNPDYRLPRTWQWNTAVEHSFGPQSISVTYAGALGRRLTAWQLAPKGAGNPAVYRSTDARSSYHSMQLQFNRRLNSRLQLLASYTWAHAIDELSTDQTYSFPGGGPASAYYNPRKKGSSDFDVRHALNGSIVAELPAPRGTFAKALLQRWTAASIFFARTGMPTDILGDNYVHRPDLAPGRPLYLHGSEFPGGRIINLDAFTIPSDGRDGSFGRNVLRGLGAWQIDLALHREFRLAERARLEFRAEAFNLFNHPNFANQGSYLAPGILFLNPSPGSAVADRMLASGLSPLGVLGGMNPLFQIGGPRSMQFVLRLAF